MDELSAQADIHSLKGQINSAIAADKGKYPWFTSFKLKNSLITLDKASAKLKDGIAKCEKKCSAHTSAWVMPWGDTVHICPGYWYWNDVTQAATLVHEGTHLGAATTDMAYFWNKSYSLALGVYVGEHPHDVLIFGWDIIASSYDTWILTGFCVPGYDCSKAPTHYSAFTGGQECP